LADIPFAFGGLEASLWVKNLTNARFDLLNFRIAGRSTSTQYNDPRTYGFETRIRF